MSTGKKLAVIAIGGNSLIHDKSHQTIPDQFLVAKETAKHIVDFVELGWNIVVTHGNGPQVGFILRRSELSIQELHGVPMDTAGADTQGAIGYMLQQCIQNELNNRNIKKQAATVVTQVLVDSNDPAIANPTKPIGSFLDEATAFSRKEELGWTISEDAGRGWRRVVASPKPMEIIEIDAITTLLEQDMIVIAVGGGGIPVVKHENQLVGIEAVIDKDSASALLANELKADSFIISTAINHVYLNFGKPNQQALTNIDAHECETLLKEGHFAKGSMQPKVEAVLSFITNGGNHAWITTPDNLSNWHDKNIGTHFSA